VVEDPGKVGSEGVLGPAFEWRDRNLIDQMAEIGGLGQDLDVEKGGDRLERDRRKFVAAMEPAW
jgi:hypothetical protein